MKKNYLVVLLFCSFVQQLKAQSVSYKILENDPDARKVFLEINPFNAQYYGPDINIGADFGIHIWLGSRFQLEGNLRKAYLDANTTGDFVPENLSKASQFYAGGAFNLISSSNTRANRVVLASGKERRNMVSVTSIDVDAQSRNVVALRGGIQRFHNNVQIDNDITEEFTENDIQAEDVDGNLIFIRDTINFETINYEANSAGFYVGLNLKTIRRVIIETDDYDTKSNVRIDDVYADVLLCPSVKYLIRPNDLQTAFSNLDFNNSVNKRKTIGWRLGWNFLSNKGAGLSWRVEGGQQPGRPDKSWFLSVGMGLSIGIKVPALERLP
jgi:hypothetical protein